jgi:uncharacterized membrane protein
VSSTASPDFSIDTIHLIAKDQNTVILLGIILLLISYFAPIPAQLDQIVNVVGWILLIVGVVMLVLGTTGRAVGGRRYWY